MSDTELREKIAGDFQPEGTGYGEKPGKELARFNILVAYMCEGNWGCDSSAWLLLQERETKALFEVHGSHCSCYGFEDQWKPEPTTPAYLHSEQFSFSCGGYDNSKDANQKAVKDFLAANVLVIEPS